MTPTEARAISPFSYRNPDLFSTGWGPKDPDAPAAREAYTRGLEASREAHARGGSVNVGVNGTWGASADGWYVSSCEVLGYHANTDALLRGFLDGPAALYVYRAFPNAPTTRTLVKNPAAVGEAA